MVTSPSGPPLTAADAGRGVAARRLAIAGLLGVTVSGLAEMIMHLLPGGRLLDPMTATISAYALEPGGWVFSAGVLILAAASMLVGAALVSGGLLRPARPWAWWYLLWCVGLIGLTVITKTEIGPNDSVQSRIHWSFTLLAFVALPLAVRYLVRDSRSYDPPRSVKPGAHPGGANPPRRPAGRSGRLPGPLSAARALVWVSVGWFILLAGQSVLSLFSASHLFPWVGLLERGVAVTEMAAVACLAWWVLHEHSPAASSGAGGPVDEGVASEASASITEQAG